MFDFANWATKDILTVAAAWIGAILGIINLYANFSQRRLRLKVRPVHGIHENGYLPGIRVVNQSAFPVVIDDVGFTLNGNSASKGHRASFVPPIMFDGKAWPRKLEPRESATFYCNPSDYAGGRYTIGRGYVGTSDGHYRYGTSPALGQIRELFAGT